MLSGTRGDYETLPPTASPSGMGCSDAVAFGARSRMNHQSRSDALALRLIHIMNSDPPLEYAVVF